MDEIYKWTVDCELDWGGRADTWVGLKEGIPIILNLFKKYNVKGLFFFSTELLDDFSNVLSMPSKPPTYYLAKKILGEGHTLGSHGHFHIHYNNLQRLVEDKRLSELILSELGVNTPFYRAPKFDKRTWKWSPPYSDPNGHVGLLKKMWLNMPVPANAIFYLHPFDIVEGNKAISLFTKTWYSRSKSALLLLETMLERYGA